MRLHHVEVELLSAAHELLVRHARRPLRMDCRSEVVTPTVVNEVNLNRSPEHHGLEIFHTPSLPACLEALGKVDVRGLVPPDTNCRRCALEDQELLRRLRQR